MKKTKIITLLFIFPLLFGCEKFLAEKPDKSLVVPSSISDLQALLDNYSIINASDPGESDMAADDYYLTYDSWMLRSEVERRGYVWEQNYSSSENNWFAAYRIVYTANSVLRHIMDIERSATNQYEWDNVRGQAYFLRAKSFLQVANIWSLAYDSNTSKQDLGIPLRLTDDPNAVSSRASVEDVYNQIIHDLTNAIELLPTSPVHPLRASRPAAFALLARAYLFMRDYENCLKFAEACLDIKNELMDYNDLSPLLSYPFPQFNIETLYYSVVSPIQNPVTNFNNALVDTTLYNLYHENDLRKSLFFRENNDGTYNIKGNYSGSAMRFYGVSTDEVFLMRAECNARLNNIEKAMNDINHLLEKRYVRGMFTPPEFLDSRQVLTFILKERRKQLIMRGLRFADIKRLNKEGANIEIKRVLEDQKYILPANDLRFALAIPETIIERAPEILQNPR